MDFFIIFLCQYPCADFAKWLETTSQSYYSLHVLGQLTFIVPLMVGMVKDPFSKKKGQIFACWLGLRLAVFQIFWPGPGTWFQSFHWKKVPTMTWSLYGGRNRKSDVRFPESDIGCKIRKTGNAFHGCYPINLELFELDPLNLDCLNFNTS